MHESKIQSLVSLVRRILNIISLLLLSHSRPLPLPATVLPHIIKLSDNIQANSQNVNGEDSRVATMIKRCIVCLVDVGAYDASSLDSHVVDGGRDGARAHTAGVSRCPCDENGVAVGVGEEHGQERVGSPGICAGAGPPPQSDEAGQHPGVLDHGDERAFFDVLAYPGDAEQGEYTDECGQDGEEIGVESAEAEMFEC